MKKIGVVGTGIMGSGIALILAQNDYQVVMLDREQAFVQQGLINVEKNLNRSVEKGRLTEEAKEQTLKNIMTTTEFAQFSDCDLIIEAATESMAIKKNIFQLCDEACKAETILATNTSSLSITEIAQATSRPEKVIGLHFFNPVPVMRLVEVIAGVATADEVQVQIMALARDLGKTPVLVEEAPGFVVNRILIPMINEAIGVLADGVASAEDIDEAMKLGANHPIGPLALADLVGLDVCLAIMEVLYEEFGDTKYRPHPLLRKMVRGDLLGRKRKQGFFTY